MNPPRITHYDDIAEDYAPIADELPGNKYWERPATLALLPPLEGLDVLDAGCGAGFYSDHCSAAGARVVGFDPSARMVDYTRGRLGDRVELHHCTTPDLETVLAGRKFDLILSCLVLHYVEDLGAEMALLAARLKPGGRIIISMRHPYMYGPPRKPRWPTYLEAMKVQVNWECGSVSVHHRPLSQLIDAFRGAGLTIDRILEPAPQPELETVKPELWRHSRTHPIYIQFVLLFQ